jgi:AcrR family transcriptional regulator
MSGLRERKKARTRATIQREALRLIATRGYDTTTCEEIASAAEVSPATLFRYFASKEEIVLQDSYDPLIAAAVRARPAEEPPLTALRRGFADALADVYQGDVEAIRQRTALIMSVPALRARSREQQESLVSHLAAALVDRAGDAGRVDVEVAGTVCASAVGLAVERWAEEGGDLPAHVDAAFAALDQLVSGDRR